MPDVTAANEFYICLPDGPGMQNIPNLMRWGAKQLRAEQEEKGPLHLAVCAINEDKNWKPYIYFNYWINNVESIELGNDLKELAKREGRTTAHSEVEYMIDPAKKPLLNCVTCRLPQDQSQEDAILLLERAADVLDALGDVHIIDVVFQDCDDANGIELPTIRAYFSPVLDSEGANNE